MNRINKLQAEIHKRPDLWPQVAALIAAAQGAATVPPARRSRRAKKNSEQISYLTEDELQRLFAMIRMEESVRDLAIFEVALGRGLRVSEVGLLRMERLRMKDRRLFVQRVKNGISNEYPLFEREVKALKTWLRIRGEQPGPLFPSNWKRPISTQRLDQLMRRYAELADLPADKRHFHCLRHTCATRLLELGAELTQVKDHLGHRDIASTIIYAQVTDRSRKALAKQLADVW